MDIFEPSMSSFSVGTQEGEQTTDTWSPQSPRPNRTSTNNAQRRTSNSNAQKMSNTGKMTNVPGDLISSKDKG